MTKRYRPRGANAATQSVALADPPPPAAPVRVTPPVGRIAPRPKISRWSPYNNWNDLDWPQVVSILRQQENGATEQWVDLAVRMRASDDHLASTWGTRIGATSGARWELRPGDALDGQADLAQRAADDCRRMLESLPNLEQLFGDILDAVAVGWSVQEIIWEPRGDTWWPADIVWLNPRRFRFADDFSLFLYDQGQAAAEARAQKLDSELVESRGASGIALTPNKYIVHVPRSLQTYPTSSGLLNACVRAWWLKSMVTRFWLSGADIAGNPRAIGTAPKDADQTVVDEMRENLDALQSDGSIVLREGSTLSLQAPLAQGSGSIWETLYKSANAAMSKAVLGSTLNVEVGDSGGNRALGESQGDITIMPRVRGDARGMWRTLERDLLTPFLRFNRHRYGGVVPPIPRGETIHYEDKINVDQILVDAGGVRLDELRQSRGLEPLGPGLGGDRLIPAAQPAAAPAFSRTVGAEAPAALPLRETPWAAAMRIATSTTSR